MADNKKTKQKVHHNYKYHIESFKIIIDGVLDKPLSMPKGCITDIVIEKNFDLYFMPLFQMSFIMNPKLREVIVLNKQKVKFNLRFQCDTLDNNDKTIFTEDSFNAIFVPLIGSEKPFYDSKIYDETVRTLNASDGNVEKLDKSGNNMTGDHRTSYTFFLYLMDDLVNTKKIVNKVYSGIDITTAIVSLLTESGFKKIMISPADNSSDATIIVPMMNLMAVFKYLEETYGIYNAGLMIFFDHRCTYVLNKNGHPNCYETGEFKKTVITIHDTKKPEHKVPGTFEIVEDLEYHIFVEPNNVHITNASMYNDHIKGNNVTLVDTRNNSVTNMGGSGNQMGSGVTSIKQNNFSNDYEKNRFISESAEGNIIIKMTIYDVYEQALTPNKEFVVNFKDPKLRDTYNGYYRLKNCSFVYSRDGDNMNISAVCEFCKKEDLSSIEAVDINNKVAPVKTDASKSSVKVPISTKSVSKITK